MGDTGGYGVASKSQEAGGGLLGMSWTVWGHALEGGNLTQCRVSVDVNMSTRT